MDEDTLIRQVRRIIAENFGLDESAHAARPVLWS
jgi:hypothetical protein